jgi:anaerobic magnesium-protoporphyrin IX monomethyl ester cyclase
MNQTDSPSTGFGLRKMGSVCLITPPSSFLLDERVFMFLGILRIGAVLEKAGYNVSSLDLSGITNFLEAVADYVRYQADVRCFGITATTPQMPAVSAIVSVIRQERPDARIILGGPHITLVCAAYKNEQKKGVAGRATVAMRKAEQMFDVLVSGDGEEAIFPALSDDSPKLIDADDRASSLFLDNARLNALPFPARHLVDVSSYHYSIDGVPALSLIAQLGCPFECGFCGGRSSPMLRKIRTRTSRSVVDEMLHLYHTYGTCGFMLYDDELNVNPKMLELMDLIAETQKALGVEWRLRGFIKAELFNEAQAEAMYRAGFRWILTGFESGSPKILTNINKKATQTDNTRCVELAHAAGLKVKALMSVGHPGETQETIEETRKWLLTARPDDFDVSIITCYPGTPYYDEAVPDPKLPDVWVYTYQKTGDRLYQIHVDHTEVADYYKGDPDGGYRAFVYTDNLTAERLVELRNSVERDVRERLGIPFNPGAPAMLYEHSMGQSGQFPSNILRKSSTT